jgi:hypothetical protein
MTHEQDKAAIKQTVVQSTTDIERIYKLTPFMPFTDEDLRSWLERHGVDCESADKKQGISNLFHKVQQGEASLVYDPESKQVYRLARVVSLDVKITLQGERYVPVELIKIFLTGDPPSREQVLSGAALDTLGANQVVVRAAQVRNSLAIWETLLPDDSGFARAAARAIHEELGIPEKQIGEVDIITDRPALEFEEAIDWPGIPSVLMRARGVAIVPEALSKPAYFEYSSKKKQLSLFTAIPDNPFVKKLLETVLPGIDYTEPTTAASPPPAPAKVTTSRSIPESLIRSILKHGSGSLIHVTATGAGGDVVGDLARLPGSSAIYAGGTFPYAMEQTTQRLGYEPPRFVSGEVSEGLANDAYLEAQRTFLMRTANSEAPLPRFIGVGLTAAIASNRERRGEDAVWISIRTPDALRTGKFLFRKDFGDEMRARHNSAVTEIALNLLAETVGASQIPLDPNLITEGLTAEGLCILKTVTPDEVQLDSPMIFAPNGGATSLEYLDPERHLIYPGSFRGFHCGHDLVARAAAQATRKQPVLEISTSNAQKAGIDADEVARRLVGVRGRYAVAVVQASLFKEKSLLYPEGMNFALGYDIAAGLVDPKYYGGNAEGVEAVMNLFRERGNVFWVLGRRGEDNIFRSFEQIPGIDSYADLFKPLYGALDVSSTQLRNWN